MVANDGDLPLWANGRFLRQQQQATWSARYAGTGCKACSSHKLLHAPRYVTRACSKSVFIMNLGCADSAKVQIQKILSPYTCRLSVDFPMGVWGIRRRWCYFGEVMFPRYPARACSWRRRESAIQQHQPCTSLRHAYPHEMLHCDQLS